MKIPQYIIDDMKRAARHFSSGAAIMERVNGWFESRGFAPEELRNCDGCSLEEIEYGNDIAEEFARKMELTEDRN